MKRFVPVAAFLAGLVSVVVSEPAFAQGAVCSSLQSQYAAAVRKLVRRRRGQCRFPQRRTGGRPAAARVNNCSSLGIFSSPGPACPGINSQIAGLQAQLRQAGGGSASFFGVNVFSRSQADQLRAALSANGCATASTGGGGSGGRSLCVRTCDGYYFPVSSAAGQRADAASCATTYGDASAVELFVAWGDDVANARSLTTNKRYADQPYAFQYRKAFDAVCVAALHDGLRTLATSTPVVPVTPATTTFALVPAVSALVPLAQARPRPSEDPETLANQQGLIVPEKFVAAAPAGDQPASMRVVGAGYYNMLLDLQQARNPAPSN